ncbi:hypothetical protein GGX14DRAFT_342171, partial [Mycena pura]
FLWKCVWGIMCTKLPECEGRATCRDCDEVEDLEQILLRCESPRRELIWEAAKTLWLEKETRWPEISLGTILGCGLAEFCNERGKVDHGRQRLYRILVSESAY